MFTGGILLLISVLQWSAKSVSLQLPNHKCITESGKIYTNGSVFTDNECTTKCECLDNGIISCQPMCLVTKKVNSCAKMKIVYTPVGLPDAQGRSCSCPSFICEPDFCSDGGKTYKPGDSFISADCSGSCVCGTGGSVSCVSLCPPTFVQCHADEAKIQFSRKIANSDCTCPDWKCVKVKRKVQDQLPATTTQPRKIKKQQCVSSNGKIYAVGQEFTDINCSSRCQCKDGGVLTCKPLCMVLPKDSFCAKQNIVHMPIKLPDAEGRSCSCPLIMCEAHEVKEQVHNANEFCYDGGNKYKPGDRFITANCDGSCVCGPGGSVSCVSLCPPTDIRCTINEEKIEFSRKIANSNCTCPASKCVTRKTRDVRSGHEIGVCIDGDNVYNPGDILISTDCRSRCTCMSGQIGCEELCPRIDITCKPGEMKKQWSEQIRDSKCSCPRWKCVKKADEFCEIFGERHKVGKFFESKDCSGYCRCAGPTSFGCVSLCPPQGIYCIPGTRKVRTVRPAFRGSNCTCPSWKCVKAENMWHPWSNWTECDAECGGGLRYRFRTCMKNEKCFGPSVETKVCNVAPCSPSFTDAPCGALRINSAEGDIWPRCDDQGYFEPLQCDPSRSECWCVDRWGNVEPGSSRISQKPQCGNSDALQAYTDAPCGALRINSAEGDIWPRCDDQGYFEPLQCDPSRSECWCVDRWGNVEPRSSRISQEPQCGNSDALQVSSTP